MNVNTSTKKAGSKNQLSCESCQRRKVRCDKGNPCTTCQRAGVKCEVISRQRLPRGRNGGRRKGDTDLQARIVKLENLVSSLGADPTAYSTTATVEPDESIDRSAFKAGGDMSKYLGSSFWSALSDEVTGLREVLDESSDSEMDTTEPSDSAESPPDVNSRGFNFVLCGPHSFMMAPNALDHPSQPIFESLFKLYFERVDPLFKVLHEPTMADLMLKGKPYLGEQLDDPAIEALKFAICYAAINTHNEQSCKQTLGDSKAELLTRYRFAVEVCLAKADFVNSEKIEIIQTFAIYLAAIRLHNHTRWSWTLFALVLRIAQSQGIHMNKLSSSLSPFQVQMRRRLWQQICVEDIRAGIDRGSEPIVPHDFSDTPLPANIDDVDISSNTQTFPASRNAFTDMSFPLMCSRGCSFIRSLVSVTDDEASSGILMTEQIWQKRQEGAENFRKTVHDLYIRYCDVQKPFHSLAVQVFEIMCDCSMLMAIRPMHIDPQIKSRPQVESTRVLSIAVEVMRKHQTLMLDPSTEPWRWFIWPQWHALAIAIAELCTQTQGPLVDAAWEAVEFTFRGEGEVVADSKSGMLWQPIQKLMKKAKQNRQNAQISRARDMAEAGAKYAGLDQSPAFQQNITSPSMAGSDVFTPSSGNNSGSAQTGLWNPDLPRPDSTKSTTDVPNIPENGGPLPLLGEATPSSFSLDMSGLNDDMGWMNWESFVGGMDFNDYDLTNYPLDPSQALSGEITFKNGL